MPDMKSILLSHLMPAGIGIAIGIDRKVENIFSNLQQKLWVNPWDRRRLAGVNIKTIIAR